MGAGIVFGTALRYFLMFAIAIPIARGWWALALFVGRVKANKARAKGRTASFPVAETVKPLNAADIFARVRAKSETRAKQTARDADPVNDPLPFGYFMLADTVVVGVAGFIAGCLGFFFLGFSISPRTWPGMGAMDLGCLIGLCVYQRVTGQAFL
jgi:hypothetical protein